MKECRPKLEPIDGIMLPYCAKHRAYISNNICELCESGMFPDSAKFVTILKAEAKRLEIATKTDKERDSFLDVFRKRLINYVERGKISERDALDIFETHL